MIFHTIFILMTTLVQEGTVSDTLRSQGDSSGNVDIVWSDKRFKYSFNLDRFESEGDSCVELFVRFRSTPDAWALFQYSAEKQWRFENIGYHDSSARRGSIKVKTVFDEAGNFLKGKIIVNPDSDSSLKIAENTVRRGDVPNNPDPPVPFDFSFDRKVFECKPERKATTIVRKFTYPPRYMRRDPVGLNYPELAMFHYGGGVHMPVAGSVNARGFIMNYWHILHPDELEYGGDGKK